MICSRVSARGLTSCASHEFVKIFDAFLSMTLSMSKNKVHASMQVEVTFCSSQHLATFMTEGTYSRENDFSLMQMQQFHAWCVLLSGVLVVS